MCGFISIGTLKRKNTTMTPDGPPPKKMVGCQMAVTIRLQSIPSSDKGGNAGLAGGSMVMGRSLSI